MPVTVYCSKIYPLSHDRMPAAARGYSRYYLLYLILMPSIPPQQHCTVGSVFSFSAGRADLHTHENTADSFSRHTAARFDRSTLIYQPYT